MLRAAAPAAPNKPMRAGRVRSFSIRTPGCDCWWIVDECNTEHCSVNGVQFNLTFHFVNPKIRFMGIAERKNREKQALRERILDASRRIVMREGFAALSMRKIADAIEYSPATLYLHFENRDEIARALCMEGYAQLLDTLKPHLSVADPAERLKAIWRAYVAFGV